MKHYFRTACSVLLIIITADVARADDTAAAPTPTPGCTIFLGGNGSRFKNTEFNQRWINVNRAAWTAAIQKLYHLHYRVEPLFSEGPDPQESLQDVYKKMREKQCDQVIQLSHELTISSEPNAIPHLSLDVLVFHLEKDPNGQSAKIVGDYQHKYPFVLTKEVMENLKISDVGETIATDVDAAHVLRARGP